MSWGIVAVAGASLVGGVYSANQQGKAAGRAADAQVRDAELGMEERRRQFDAVQAMLKPYVDAGGPALQGQQDLLGLNGGGAQGAAIAEIENSPQFAALMQQGENAILQNASATGGLRGGNTQAALGQYRPALLAQLIEQQYGRLGGMVELGQNSAAGVGAAGMRTGEGIAALLQQRGAARAGGYMAEGRTQAGYANALTGAIGQYVGGGFGGFTKPNAYGAYANPAGETVDYRGTMLPNSLRGGF